MLNFSKLGVEIRIESLESERSRSVSTRKSCVVIGRDGDRGGGEEVTTEGDENEDCEDRSKSRHGISRRGEYGDD